MAGSGFFRYRRGLARWSCSSSQTTSSEPAGSVILTRDTRIAITTSVTLRGELVHVRKRRRLPMLELRDERSRLWEIKVLLNRTMTLSRDNYGA